MGPTARALIASVLVSVAAPGAAAQCLSQTLQQLLAPDPSAFDAFGLAVALDGTRAVVGVENDDDLGTQAGAAYVFDLVAGEWIFSAKLHAADGTFFQLFGGAVDVDGGRIVVGARQDGAQGGSAGAAYVFDLVGTAWVQTAKLTGSDGSGADNLGTAVAVDGDVIVAGAPQEDLPSLNAGAAYVFELDRGTWSEAAKLTGADIVIGSFFGGAVALDGERAVVGAVSATGVFGGQGAAYVFERVDGRWVQTAKLGPSDGLGFERFGNAVAVSGPLVVVGQPDDTEPLPQSGSAYVFVHDGTGWTQQAKLVPDVPEDFALFGYAVAVEDGEVPVALVGEPDDIFGSEPGAAYVFERHASWEQAAKFLSPDATPADRYGRSVALSGGLGLVGEGGADIGVTSTGAAWMLATCTWEDLGGGLAGAAGAPLLAGQGTLLEGAHGLVSLTAAAPSAVALLFIAFGEPGSAPFKGGVLQAFPVALLAPAVTDAQGAIDLGFEMPAGFSGVHFVLQWAVADAGAPVGAALSNALQGQAP